MIAAELYRYSSYREMLLEHLFAGAVMRHLWLQDYKRVEVLKPQVDDSGYDLVLEANGIVRHVQMKSSHATASAASVNVNEALALKPSGCVIWTRFNQATMDTGPFLWFGDEPGIPLPSIYTYKRAKYTKGDATGFKAERKNTRVVPKSAFVKLETIDHVVARLFGPFPWQPNVSCPEQELAGVVD